MRRRIRGVLIGALGLAMSTGAILAGTGNASAAQAARTGTVTLTPRSDSVTDGSPFAQVAVDRACPAGYQESVSVFLVAPDGTESAIAYHVTDGAPFSSAPIAASVPAASTGTTYVNSIADAFANVNATLADGTYPIHVVCGSADPAHHPERPTSTGFIDVTGGTWHADSRQAPIAVTIKLSASPSGHALTGSTVTLKAAVIPAVTGTVQFASDGAYPIGGPVQVVDGAATVQVPGITRPGDVLYTATFVPADQLGYAQAYGTAAYSFVAAPSITVTDAAGNVLGGTPQLAPGQRITVSATGFRAGGGETVDASISRVLAGVLPAVLPSTSSGTTGSVTGYTVTVPNCIASGTHRLTLTGEDTGITVSFPFTTGK
jgi:hypothetical protein